MQVDIVRFPATWVAVIEHRGAPDLEHATVQKLIAWKIEHRLLDQALHRSYGLHYTDPHSIAPAEHRVDFCLSIEESVASNVYGIREGMIPMLRCARARDIGSRSNNQAAAYLYNVWLPQSGEAASEFPMIFHYVNVGPDVKEQEMITDVYLPLRQ
ncbi:MAG TPA: GyrI-like domain-containing protein [Spongiibacteraceae bacterium]|nr:GyrI-like domain-containing protein [Spongiibacteraceae bacterium]